jgi:hypothetical protein
MKGIVTAEQEHVVNILPPVDITGGKTSQAFSMAKHGHATIIVQIGVSAAAFTKIILQAGTATAAVGAVVAGAAALAFSLYSQETAGADQDVLGARAAVAAAGYTPTANDGVFYVIELDASELPDGSPWVQLSLTNGVNSVIASAVAILSGERYAGSQSATATA